MQQRLRYLGIPLRLGWQWYSKAHLSLYSSAGIMLEWPIHSRVNTLHQANGSRKKLLLMCPSNGLPPLDSACNTTSHLILDSTLNPACNIFSMMAVISNRIVQNIHFRLLYPLVSAFIGKTLLYNHGDSSSFLISGTILVVYFYQSLF